MKRKIYVPIEKDKVMALVSSADGFVIPLFYFGYESLHLTLYLKTIAQGVKISVHITDEKLKKEGNTSIIFERCIILDQKTIEGKIQRLENFVLKINQKYLPLFKKENIRPYGPSLICPECYVQNLELNLHKKHGALEIYEFLAGDNFDIKEIKLYPISNCKNTNHKLIWDTRNQTLSRKFNDFILPFTLLYGFSNEFFDFLHKEFAAEEIVSSIFADIKDVLNSPPHKR